MAEQAPAQRSDQREHRGIWDAGEQVGDVYAVDVASDGQIERAERLLPRPQVWVGSWLDYNHGVLHGEWLDAARSERELEDDIQAMLAASPITSQYGDPAEDWGIFDFDGFGPLQLGEQASLSWVTAVARGTAEHGQSFAAYANLVEDTAALDGFPDDYLGRWDSLAAYVEEFTDDAGYNRLLDEALPDSVRRYVRLDTAAIARDMQAGGDVHVVTATDGNGVWLFHSR